MNEMVERYIIIEGPEGSGKTTLSRFFGEELEFSVIKNPTDIFHPIMDSIWKYSDYGVKYLYYVASNIDALNNAGKLGKPSVVERSFPSTVSTFAVLINAYLGGNNLEKVYENLLEHSKKSKEIFVNKDPYAIVILTPHKEVAKRRIFYREGSTKIDILLLEYHDWIIGKLKETAEEIFPSSYVICIDNSNLQPHQTFSKVIAKLKEVNY